LKTAVTDKAQRTILIKWVRSGIGFTRRQKGMVRSLGLRRLNQMVERVDSPQVRGLVARIPHLVEIVEITPRPPAWASVPEYTLLPAEAVPREPAPESEAAFPAEEAAVAATSPADEAALPTEGSEAEEVPAPVEKPKPAKAAKAAKPAKSGAEKGEAPKVVKETGKKKAKSATEKTAKPPKAGKK
jgi:large subunit ribosomal protein L30